jgi:cytochrome P450
MIFSIYTAETVCRDHDFDYQSKDSAFADTMRSLIQIVTFGQETNLLKRWSPIKYQRIWSWGRYLDAFIHAELEKRFAERRASEATSNQLDSKGRKVRSIVALALDNYLADDTKQETRVMDLDFKHHATTQIRTFLIAGHDTTSSAITYGLHLLHSHPDFLAQVRTEHDNVFGTNVGATSTILKSNPSLLNQLPLTLAAIKESLRLFPPAGGIRMGNPEITLTAEDGTQFPTANCQVWVNHDAMHRNPAYWPSPDTYLPDRWLVGPEHSLYPVKGAWLPFGMGPHLCMGQTLAMLEIKTILVLTLRKFDIKNAYEEWDCKYPSKGMKTVMGERAYQVTGGGGGQHPADRYPCRVAIRE